jgi:hypothetical protein
VELEGTFRWSRKEFLGGVGRNFRWSRSRKEFLGGVGVVKNVPIPIPTPV